jgi:hypothetical protein
LFRIPVRQAELAGAKAARHAHWRETSDGVAEAYRSWAAAPRSERWLAHAAYLAALEREEHAARAYQELVELPGGAVGGRSRGLVDEFSSTCLNRLHGIGENGPAS